MPVVALGLGSVAGLGAARLVTSHYSVMVEGTSHMFVAGPPVVARAGENVNKEELGGSDIHARTGAVDDEVASEAEAFARARRFLSYLPSSVYELPRAHRADRRSGAARAVADRGDPARPAQGLQDAPHHRARWSTRTRSSRSAANSAARSITGLARLDGWPVAVLASDPYFYGGGWTADAAQKVARFVDLAEHVPSAGRASSSTCRAS